MELKNAAGRYELLEKENQAKSAGLNKALDAVKETRSKIRDAREELRQAGEIAAGNPYLLRMKFLDPKYALLDKLWSAADEYADLAKSAADATKLFKDQKGPKVEKLFWSQFHTPVRPLLLNKQLTDWAELHRLSGLAIRSIAFAWFSFSRISYRSAAFFNFITISAILSSLRR